jgi:hypothetical protein
MRSINLTKQHMRGGSGKSMNDSLESWTDIHTCIKNKKIIKGAHSRIHGGAFRVGMPYGTGYRL